MRKIILYAAISLDSKIAKSDGSIDWLHKIPNPSNSDYGYAEFLESIDTTLMGNKTYQQIRGFGIDFPYKGKKNFVLTRNTASKEDENVNFISENIGDFIRDLKLANGKNIWLIGGAQINTLLLQEGLIDEIRVFVMPVILGGGIPLFQDGCVEASLELIKSENFDSGVVGLTYTNCT